MRLKRLEGIVHIGNYEFSVAFDTAEFRESLQRLRRRFSPLRKNHKRDRDHEEVIVDNHPPTALRRNQQ